METEAINMRKAGATLQQIGDRFGYSREAARLKTLGIKPNGLLSYLELANLVNHDINTIRNLEHRGIIKSASIYRSLFGQDAVDICLKHYACHICGSLMPKRRKSYCCGTCAKVGAKRMAKRGSWRQFYKRQGRPFTPSIDYVKK